MVGQPDEYPPYDDDCPPRFDENGEEKPNVSELIEFTECEAENGLTICWDKGLECEQSGIGPQGYFIYKTTTPPVTGHEALCLSFTKDPVLYDRSSWKHTVTLYSGSIATPTQPVFTNKTPFGFLPESQSINFYREPTPPSPPQGGPNRRKEYLYIPSTTRFDFRDDDFTIEFWAGNHRVPWLYYFPVQTLVACYDAANNRRCWRIYIEPYSVTQSQAGCRCGSCTWGTPPGCSTKNQSTGTLVVEFYENGDGSGQSIKQNVMTLNSNSNWRSSPTGNTGNFGYMHVAVLRKNGVMQVYVDGVLRTSVAMPWFVAYNGQAISVGRHFGNSGRLNSGQFTPRSPDWTPVPGNDGDHSYFHGGIYDLRITKNEAAIPPVGGRPDNVCKRPVWFDLFTKVAAVPRGVTCWTDPNPAVGKRQFYRITSSQCDQEVPARCPSYISARINRGQQFSNLWVSTSADLISYLNKSPPTLLDIFNDWDRSNPTVRGRYWPKAVGSTGEHAAWFFDNSKGSFVQPINTNEPVHIVSPEAYYQTNYTHEAVLKSNQRDDDTIGIVGAYTIDNNGDHWSLVFARTNGGMQPQAGWGAYVLGPGVNTSSQSLPTYNACGADIGSQRQNLASHSCGTRVGSTGWSGITTSVMVQRDNNIIRGYASDYKSSSQTTRGSHRPNASFPEIGGVYDSSTMIEIDFNNTPPPAPLADWSMFLDRPSGVGFMAWSQGDAFYQDWFYHPLIKQRIFDFTNGAPGEVWEYDKFAGWYKTPDTAWEVVNKQATRVIDPDTGLEANFSCRGDVTI